MASPRGFAFSSAMGMIHRIHGHPAHLGSLTQPATSAGLAEGDPFMQQMAALADSGLAGQEDLAHFSGGHFDLTVFVLPWP